MEVRADPMQSSDAAASSVELDDRGLAVPVTPPREFVMVDSPRASASTRQTDGGSDETLKKQRCGGCQEAAHQSNAHGL